MEENSWEKSNYVLAASADGSSLSDPLQKFYEDFKDKAPGEYVGGFGTGIDNLAVGPILISVDEFRTSIVRPLNPDGTHNSAKSLTVIQGYAQAVFFDRFYASSLMVGKASTVSAGDMATLAASLETPKRDREALEFSKRAKAKLDPSFYVQNSNDPFNQAKNTNGIYIIDNYGDVSHEYVFSGVGIADFADNAVFSLAVAVSANINTFKNEMTFTVAANFRLASSKRLTVTGELGLLNGKLNSIGFSVKGDFQIWTSVTITGFGGKVKGFQEPKIGVGANFSAAFGQKVEVPEWLGSVRKALFPNKTTFFPVELSLSGEIDPARDYFSVSGQGKVFGIFNIGASYSQDPNTTKVELKAGLVRNNFLNASMSGTYTGKQDNWNLRVNLNGSVTVDLWIVGVSVRGELDVLFNSLDYTWNNGRYNRKDLTITVNGSATIKLLFSVTVAVHKTWVANLSNTQLASADLLMSTLSAGDMSALDNAEGVITCESEDIAEVQLPRLRVSSDVIETQSWEFDEQCSASGLVTIQVAAEYTLVDSNWRLTHTSGDTVTVYTAETAGDVVTVKEYTHGYYELLLDTPDAGIWTLEMLGDSSNSGGIYINALKDEKFVTELKILEETDTTIKFGYTAITGSKDDTTVVKLFAEEISDVPGYEPFSGVIAYLEETGNGEYIWEIPEDFRHNANYRFYISAATSGAGSLTESKAVEVFLARQNADLECSWELAYNADNHNTVTAYITVKNTGAESTTFQWEILDYTNNNSIDDDNSYYGNTSDIAEILASGSDIEIKGNSSVTFEQVITVTDELRDNPSSLHLSVTQQPSGEDILQKNDADANTSDEETAYADDTDEILFAAMGSDNCKTQTVSWQAVDGAEAYILHYALEGDWDTGGVYINNIYDTSYVLNVAPGEYTYRVIAVDSEGKAIGTWSEEKEFDVLFHDEQTLHIAEKTSRSQVFSLNDGIYNLNGVDLQNFTGTLTLFRNDLVKTGEADGNTTLMQVENDILTLTVINGVLKNPASEVLLDHGDYFWQWTLADNDGSAFDIKLELSGEVFSIEQKDREIISIGDDTNEMPQVGEAYVETLEGEVGFSNKDAIYQYLTDDGGELSITIKSGTVFESDVDLSIYMQDYTDGEFDCVKTVTVKAGEYTEDTVLINRLVIKNNFHIQVAAPDDGEGKYNTEYSFDLSFDAFEDSVQEEDILTVNGESLEDWIGYRNEEHRYLLQIKSDDRYAVRLDGDAHDAILKVCEVNGTVIEEKYIGVNGTAYIDDIYLQSGNYFVIVNSADKGEGQFNTDYVLSAYELKTLYPLIDNSDDTLELAAAKESFAFNTSIENWVGTGDKADFFKFSLDPESQQAFSCVLTVDAQTAQAVKDGLLEINCCDRFGQSLELEALPEGIWKIETSTVSGEIYVGILSDSAVEDMDYSFKVSNVIVPGNLSGSQEGISWDIVPGASKYIVEYSQDNFENVLCQETLSNKIDFFDLPAGVWQWRVKTIGGVFSNTEQIVTGGNVTVQKLVSEANGNTDMFFANANGKWESGYAAQHTGIRNGWNGTSEQVTLTGKNKLADIFEGSSDANILLLTDDANGDALFVDDIYTALPETVAEQQARIAQIDEIRAGAGDDIVDMTSQRFAYIGDGVKIYGGNGNDTIWANNGSNTLFGDAGNDRLVGGANNDVIVGGIGNDRMHGGGGDDIFTFGNNWGNDTIEQLDGGEITLWFESGEMSNWNADTLTYSDGTNSVKVSGVSNDNITLIFGDDGSLRYDELATIGCFDDAASEKIFEDKNKGMLA